jgi:isoamylase
LKPSFFSDSQWVDFQLRPLGSYLDSTAAIFIAFSEFAQTIEVVLFNADGTQPLRSSALEGPFNGRFYGQVEPVELGQVYGFRVSGPSDVKAGHCFDSTLVLLDPGAKEVIHLATDNERVAQRDRQPLARVTEPIERLGKAQTTAPRLKRNRCEVVIYEVHVKGFTMTMPKVDPSIRGTYCGFASDAALAHLKSLGVNTVCLLPIQAHMTEAGVAARGMVNYWGYNTLAFNFPDPRYAINSADPTAIRHEFAAMVARLHEADIDVVLDVVYNHTAEAGVDGPTLSFRGFDNLSWYRGAIDSTTEKWQDWNDSGCGNTLNFSHPQVRQFVLDSLRYWVEEFDVDGFRFDLATVLGRNPIAFDSQAAFFRQMQADPFLSQVLLIAEPWDAGPNGYQLSEFPAPFLEWNDRYRDCMRRYWMGGAVTRAEFAQRLAGSNDIFAEKDRGPTASINFVSVHDGYTLLDACTYVQKRNQANGENNRDGRDGELSVAFAGNQRLAIARALMATLLLSQGTPMLAAGDEIGKTQAGNNNAYCQDNAVSWLDWERVDNSLLTLAQFTLRLRQQYPLLRHPRWFNSQKGSEKEPALYWRHPRGHLVSGNDWHDWADRSLAVVFDGGPSQTRFMLLTNPSTTAQYFVLHEGPSPGLPWFVVLDTAKHLMQWPQDVQQLQAKELAAQALGSSILCGAGSLLLLFQPPELT